MSNDQKSGTVIFVKKIQTLDYILSPQAKRMAKSKQQARRLLELIVYTVHSTHIYPLWQSLLIIASSSNFYSFSLYYAIPTIPNQTSSNVGHCDSFPACLCVVDANRIQPHNLSHRAESVTYLFLLTFFE